MLKLIIATEKLSKSTLRSGSVSVSNNIHRDLHKMPTATYGGIQLFEAPTFILSIFKGAPRSPSTTKTTEEKKSLDCIWPLTRATGRSWCCNGSRREHRTHSHLVRATFKDNINNMLSYWNMRGFVIYLRITNTIIAHFYVYHLCMTPSRLSHTVDVANKPDCSLICYSSAKYTNI